MKKLLITLLVVALVMAFAAPVLAHPKGPRSMPAQSLKGTHTAVFNLVDNPFPYHIMVGLMLLTGVPCHE